MAELTSIPLHRIDGAPSTLADFRGKVALVVNVASECGLTPQYEGLQKLYARFRDQGLVVLGFPANDFGAQEPGSNAEIAQFCSAKFSVTFPMFEKLVINGAGRHPLYQALIDAQPKAQGHDDKFERGLEGYGLKRAHPTDVLWNFEKFLLGRDGRVVGRFAPDITPEDPLLVGAIERALAEG